MGLFDLVREEQEAKKKAEESAKKDTKDAVVEEDKKETDQQPAPVESAEKQATEEVKQAVEQATEIAEESKKEEKPAGKKSTKKTEKTYKYPFGIYSEGRLIDVSSYGFVDGQDYTEKEITDIMLKHRHYEFSGKMEYNFIKDDNVLVANAAQHRKG